LLIVSCSSEHNKKVALIKGEVLSGNATEVKFEWIVDNPISGNGNTFIAQIDSSSNFSIEIPIERIATGRITVGRYYHEICLIPGDDLFISVDSDTIAYSGKGAAKNNFLYHSEINGLWNREYYKEFNKGELTPTDFLASVADFKHRRIDFLKTYSDSIKIQSEFVELFKIETQVIYENLIQDYPRRYAYNNSLNPDSLELPIEYSMLNCFSNYVDDSKTISSDYIHSLRNQLYNKASEIASSDTALNWNDAIYVALFDSLQGKTREYVLTKWIITEFSRDSYDTLAIEKFNEIEKGELAQSTFTAGLNKFIEKRSLIGQPLHPEFSSSQLIDTSGVHLSFGDMMDKYKGKVVYLDFWGMGCGPCRAAMPYAKILKEKLEDKPIEFVYVSLEGINKNNWDKVFETTFTDKNHYVMAKGFDSRLHKFMEINWVPSYMIFDKEGKMIDFNADRPSRMIEIGVTQLEKTLTDLAME
jgi:thiol-disulfide isomerase/thioredoxin